MGVSNGGDGGPLRWAHKVVRLTEEAMQLVAPAVSPRAFKGGLGEPPTPRGLVDEPILDKEHRFWLVIKHVSSTDKCTLLPLIATGRFGGCGRRSHSTHRTAPAWCWSTHHVASRISGISPATYEYPRTKRTSAVRRAGHEVRGTR